MMLVNIAINLNDDTREMNKTDHPSYMVWLHMENER